MEQLQLIDTKKLCELIGISRQRLHELRTDPASGFPEPCKIGRSVRWIVNEVLDWVQATKPGNSGHLADLIRVRAQRGSKTRLEPSARPEWRTRESQPSTAEIEQHNERVRAWCRSSGETAAGRAIQTAEGTRRMCLKLRELPVKGELAEALKPLELRKSYYRLLDGTRVGVPGRQVPAAPQTPALELTGYQNGAAHTVSVIKLKADYEAGSSLDALCKRYRIGKTRLSKLLADAGTRMRPPGRRGSKQPLAQM